MTAPSSAGTDAGTDAGTGSVLLTGSAGGGLPAFAGVVLSEWTKLRSVRSTKWTIFSLVVVMVGLGALICFAAAATFDQVTPAERAVFDATATSLAGLGLAQLAMAVLGVTAIGSEYSTGGIRTTFVAVPRRLRVLAAKAIVIGAVALVAGTVTAFAAFFAGQAMLSSAGIETALGEPGVFRAVVGAGLYLAGSSLFGLAVGTLLRSTSGGIAVTVAALLVVPIVTLLLPGAWGDAVQRYVTANAASQITAVRPSPDALGPWTGYLVFTLWWVAIFAVGALRAVRRDA